MAERDLAVVTALRNFIGVGSIDRRPPQRARWQPTVIYTVSGGRGIREAVIPFCDTFLIASAKRTQYLRWRERFMEYEARFPSNWGTGPSPCAIAGCDKPVRGRGLCRAHYYRGDRLLRSRASSPGSSLPKAASMPDPLEGWFGFAVALGAKDEETIDLLRSVLRVWSNDVASAAAVPLRRRGHVRRAAAP